MNPLETVKNYMKKSLEALRGFPKLMGFAKHVEALYTYYINKHTYFSLFCYRDRGASQSPKQSLAKPLFIGVVIN